MKAYLKAKILVPVLGLLALSGSSSLQAAMAFRQTNLVSDLPGVAHFTDPNLANPWGIAFGPTSPFWIANNKTGTSTLYTTNGTKVPLVVSIPASGGGTGAPTGQVFNGTTDFNGDRFIFSSEDGAITGWRGALGTTAEILSPGSPGAIYKGLAIGSTGGFNYLYAADFHNGRIDVIPGSGAPALAGGFSDPNLPAGFAPFNIQNVGGQLFVTYARQDDEGEDDVPGPGSGYVNRFDLNGNLLARYSSTGALNSPWGLAVAPEGFGSFGGDLLIGNFGEGTINAYDLDSGDFVGMLKDSHGNPLINEGLWGLTFGNGGSGGRTDTLYFTAGISGDGDVEDHGLFGSISPVPEPSIVGSTAGLALVSLCFTKWLRRRKNQCAA